MPAGLYASRCTRFTHCLFYMAGAAHGRIFNDDYRSSACRYWRQRDRFPLPTLPAFFVIVADAEHTLLISSYRRVVNINRSADLRALADRLRIYTIAWGLRLHFFIWHFWAASWFRLVTEGLFSRLRHCSPFALSSARHWFVKDGWFDAFGLTISFFFLARRLLCKNISLVIHRFDKWQDTEACLILFFILIAAR